MHHQTARQIFPGRVRPVGLPVELRKSGVERQIRAIIEDLPGKIVVIDVLVVIEEIKLRLRGIDACDEEFDLPDLRGPRKIIEMGEVVE
jgi:hypothetical protein